MSSISIYAEFLINIHQVSVFIKLPSISDGDTTVNLSHNRRAVIVNHRGAQRILQLPCQVVEGSSLTLPPTGYQEISLRFQAAPEVCSPQKGNETSGDDVPWPASSLTPETKIACGSCKSVLVDRAIQKWKDLPRENWAEMMDFWHCHKPDPEESPELRNHSLKKGYTASNRLIPSQGVGLVDISHFHLLWSNCIGIKKVDSETELVCSACSTDVGSQGEDPQLVRLYKGSVHLQRNVDTDWQRCSVQKIISAQLLASIENQAVRKFLAYNGDIKNIEEGLLLWILNPDLVYSSTSDSEGSKRAMKILYRSAMEPAKLLEKNFISIDEIQLSNQVLNTLREDLNTSNQVMPSSARKLQEWHVGLLHR